MRALDECHQSLGYIVSQASAQVLVMVKRQHSIQDRVDRLSPVLRLQIQRDNFFIYPRILQPRQEVCQIIDRDRLPPQPPFIKVRKIVLQEDACQTESISGSPSIVPELQVLENRFDRCAIIIGEIVPGLSGAG